MVAASHNVLWHPTEDERQHSPLGRFAAWLRAERGLSLTNYEAMWRWSTSDIEGFWGAVWDYFEVGDGDHGPVLGRRTMPGARWFPEARVNYAREMLRRAPSTAVVALREGEAPRTLTADELRGRVGALAATLRELGVEPGDRVAGFLPNIPETLIALLATTSIGAVWTACAPDFGTQSVLDRFRQVEPKVLIATDGYRFNGKDYDRREVVSTLRAGLPSLRATIAVGDVPGAIAFETAVASPREPVFADVPFGHPLWILFSSGTTGTPKGIVQSHGGIVLEHLKSIALGSGVRPGDRFYFFSSTSWMVWNWLVGGLLAGATPVLYDGSPSHPDLLGSWRVAAATEANVLGAGAAYLTACEKAGLEPGGELDLRALRSVISSGSPLPRNTWRWVYEHVSADVRLDSSSGGTEICGAIVSGSPWLPVYTAEISGPCLGVKAAAYDDAGNAVVGTVGELVIEAPMPSMPIGFWDDPTGSRYEDAYFRRFPGVWTHGDWIEFTEHGSAIISGRSDATLNKAGVRMGSSDIYAIADAIAGVADSLVVGIELPDGAYYMPLFVVLEPDAAVDEVRERIRAAIRRDLSPRHLPDEIVVAPAIPRTLTGKRLEVPIKRILRGAAERPPSGAIADADAFEFFAEFGRRAVVPRLGRTTELRGAAR